jgi:hypothetical protein
VLKVLLQQLFHQGLWAWDATAAAALRQALPVVVPRRRQAVYVRVAGAAAAAAAVGVNQLLRCVWKTLA